MLDWPGVIALLDFLFGECLEGWRLLSQLCRAWGVQSRPSWLGLGRWLCCKGSQVASFMRWGWIFCSASKLARLTTAATLLKLRRSRHVVGQAFERKVALHLVLVFGLELQPLLVSEQAQRIEFGGGATGSGSTTASSWPRVLRCAAAAFYKVCAMCLVPLFHARLLKGRLAPGWAALGHCYRGQGTWALVLSTVHSNNWRLRLASSGLKAGALVWPSLTSTMAWALALFCCLSLVFQIFGAEGQPDGLAHASSWASGIWMSLKPRDVVTGALAHSAGRWGCEQW